MEPFEPPCIRPCRGIRVIKVACHSVLEGIGIEGGIARGQGIE